MSPWMWLFPLLFLIQVEAEIVDFTGIGELLPPILGDAHDAFNFTNEIGELHTYIIMKYYEKHPDERSKLEADIQANNYGRAMSIVVAATSVEFRQGFFEYMESVEREFVNNQQGMSRNYMNEILEEYNKLLRVCSPKMSAREINIFLDLTEIVLKGMNYDLGFKMKNMVQEFHKQVAAAVKKETTTTHNITFFGEIGELIPDNFRYEPHKQDYKLEKIGATQFELAMRYLEKNSPQIEINDRRVTAREYSNAVVKICRYMSYKMRDSFQEIMYDHKYSRYTGDNEDIMSPKIKNETIKELMIVVEKSSPKATKEKLKKFETFTRAIWNGIDDFDGKYLLANFLEYRQLMTFVLDKIRIPLPMRR